jgi:hypothetical protein
MQRTFIYLIVGKQTLTGYVHRYRCNMTVVNQSNGERQCEKMEKKQSRGKRTDLMSSLSVSYQAGDAYVVAHSEVNSMIEKERRKRKTQTREHEMRQTLVLRTTLNSPSIVHWRQTAMPSENLLAVI